MVDCKKVGNQPKDLVAETGREGFIIFGQLLRKRLTCVGDLVVFVGVSRSRPTRLWSADRTLLVVGKISRLRYRPGTVSSLPYLTSLISDFHNCKCPISPALVSEKPLSQQIERDARA